MQPLDKALRSQLEKTVKAARTIAELAAQAALEQLGVGHDKPEAFLTDVEKVLRNRLRTHGKQLGDERDSKSSNPTYGKQAVQHLVQEVAYEHWHRMLFARFLADNDLLMYDGVAVTLEECDELAADEGAKSGWELAGKLAARMLPQVFKPGSPVFSLTFAPEHQSELERLLKDLPDDVFKASDSLGWVYQFWQADNKERINKSEVKIGADELPAVTQLFTEPYMVAFLLHNSLGAWWITRHPDIPCPVDLAYLRTSPPNPLSFAGEGETSTVRMAKADLRPNPLSFAGEGETEGSEILPGNSSLTEKGRMDVPAIVTGNSVSEEKLALARNFRKNPTSEEAQVWEWLRDRRMLGLKFRRQQVIEGFIADFYCDEHRLVLELDGAVHDSEEARTYDNARTAVFESKKLHVLRVRNSDCTREELERRISAAILPSPFRRGGGGEVVPAAGKFEGWPDTLAEFKLLDPCCGSGHFLVAAFLMLVPMRMAAESLSSKQAIDRVLADNLHGLELDPRCVEIAVFAVALEAWRYPDLPSPSGRGGGGEGKPLGVREIPVPNIACCGLKVAAKAEDWEALVPDDAPLTPVPLLPKGEGYGSSLRESHVTAAHLRLGLRRLHETFAQAPLLGSLLDPSKADTGDLFAADYRLLTDLLDKALATEYQPNLFDDKDDRWELALSAQGLLEAARLLDARYHLVITNVPYLSRGKQDERLKDYCETHYPTAKNDLANVFLERCLELALPPSPSGRGVGGEGRGVVQIVMPQNWLFLGSYKKQREQLLKRVKWNLLARLGEGGFESSQAAGAFIILLTQTRVQPEADAILHGIDVSEPRTAQEKAELLRGGVLKAVNQKGQLGNPDHRIVLEEHSSEVLLSAMAIGLAGILNGDSPRFQKLYWEMPDRGDRWVFQQGTVEEHCYFGGMEKVIDFDEPNGHLRELKEIRRERLHDSDQRGNQAWGKHGIAISQMRELPASRFVGNKFDSNIAVVLPKREEDIPAIWCFCSSAEFNDAVRRIDQKLNVTNATLVKVPFDLEHWTKVAAEKYPSGLPKPYSDDPTQWIFHGHPQPSTDPLQVAVARLLGYTWPAESTLTPTLSQGEREQENPLPLGEGGRRPGEVMELSDEAREWIARSQTLSAHADADGIVCIPPVGQESAASDRLLNLLAAAYNQVSPRPLGEGQGGEGWSNDTLAQLLNNADHAGKSLETWLREKFFAQHCKRFGNRPFIWQVWDGLSDGFSALVNYHKLNYKTLESLIYTYLGDWISRQKRDAENRVDGAQEKLAAAEVLKKRLELILEGEKPYDIFVRWKPLEEQPIGWNPDLNDGVRMNIRPFLSVPDVGKRGAGVLRDKPNIKWEKDRGADVASAPWYNLGPVYGGNQGDRINDHHLSLEEKRLARDKTS
jgi:very-short-patch-repair endonuclease